MFKFKQIENWVNHNVSDEINEYEIIVLINTFISQFNLSPIKNDEKRKILDEIKKYNYNKEHEKIIRDLIWNTIPETIDRAILLAALDYKRAL